MPLQPSITTPIILGNIAAAACVGIGAIQLATGIANGLAGYTMFGVSVVTSDIGTFGAGVGVGACIFTPAALTPAMQGFFAGQGIVGPLSIPLATQIANALSICISSSIVTTVSAGVGVGAGVGTLIPPISGIPFFSAGFKAAGITGVQGENTAIAIANALDATISTAIVTVAIAGPPNIAPSGGVGNGKIF